MAKAPPAAWSVASSTPPRARRERPGISRGQRKAFSTVKNNDGLRGRSSAEASGLPSTSIERGATLEQHGAKRQAVAAARRRPDVRRAEIAPGITLHHEAAAASREQAAGQALRGPRRRPSTSSSARLGRVTVIVEQHGLDAEPFGQAAHAQGVKPVTVGHTRDHLAGDALDQQRPPRGTAEPALLLLVIRNSLRRKD